MEKDFLVFNWVGKRKQGGGKHGDDVSIRIANQSTEHRCVTFTFRNDSWKFFTDTESFVVANFKNRVYFKGEPTKNGIALKGNKSTVETTRYARITNDTDVSRFVAFVGDYELKHDEFYDLYYVENTELNKGDK